MIRISRNYRPTLILLLGILLGAMVGLGFGEKASVLAPLGDLFINLMFVVIVPLVFLTITTSISKSDNKKRLNKVMISIIGIFVVTSLIAVVIGFLTTFKTNLVNSGDVDSIRSVFESSVDSKVELNLLARTVEAISVSDFFMLFSKSYILPLIIISILVMKNE